MVFSVPDHNAAAVVIASLQDGLERLGLAINSSKTKVLTKVDFAADHLPEVNEALSAFTDRKTNRLTQDERAEFDRNARAFARSRPTGEWDRVLRRFYNAARRFQSTVLAPYSWRHIESYPENGAHILEYMQTVWPTRTTLEKIFGIAMNAGAVYDDLQIRCYETILHMPFENRTSIRRLAVQKARDHIVGNGCEPASPYAASLALLAIYKFGKSDDFQMIDDILSDDDCPLDVAKQGYVLLRSSGRSEEIARSIPPRYNDPELWRIAHFFDELERAPSKVLRIAETWMKPKGSTNPERHYLRARSLPLFEALFRRCPQSKVFLRILGGTRNTLGKVSDRRLRDRLSLARLREIERESQ